MPPWHILIRDVLEDLVLVVEALTKLLLGSCEVILRDGKHDALPGRKHSISGVVMCARRQCRCLINVRNSIRRSLAVVFNELIVGLAVPAVVVLVRLLPSYPDLGPNVCVDMKDANLLLGIWKRGLESRLQGILLVRQDNTRRVNVLVDAQLLETPTEPIVPFQAFRIDEAEGNVGGRFLVGRDSDMVEEHVEPIRFVGIVHAQYLWELLPHLEAPWVCPEDGMDTIVGIVLDKVLEALLLKHLDPRLGWGKAAKLVVADTLSVIVYVPISEEIV